MEIKLIIKELQQTSNKTFMTFHLLLSELDLSSSDFFYEI